MYETSALTDTNVLKQANIPRSGSQSYDFEIYNYRLFLFTKRTRLLVALQIFTALES
jgi:hypothetical protein